jgi:hypothetical protein
MSFDFSDNSEYALGRRKREEASAAQKWNVFYAVAGSILAIALVGPGLGTVTGLIQSGLSPKGEPAVGTRKQNANEPKFEPGPCFVFGAVAGIVGGVLGAVAGLYLYIRLRLGESSIGYVLLFLMLLGGVLGTVFGTNQSTEGTPEQGAVAWTTGASSGLCALGGFVLIMWIAHAKPQTHGPPPLPVPQEGAEDY